MKTYSRCISETVEVNGRRYIVSKLQMYEPPLNRITQEHYIFRGKCIKDIADVKKLIRREEDHSRRSSTSGGGSLGFYSQ